MLRMLFLLFFTVLSVSGAIVAVTPSPQACSEDGDLITLTPNGFSLPLTEYSNDPQCIYYFTVPKGYFAFVDLKAYFLQQNEVVLLIDSAGTGVQNDYTASGFSNYSSVQSWALDFQVNMQTKQTGSTAQMSLDIKVLPATPTANIVKSYVTNPGTSAVFLYSNQWNDGDSYKFTSKTGKVYLLGASLPNSTIFDNTNWNNMFIYDGGVFNGTLVDAVQAPWCQKPYISTSNEIILYCSKKVNIGGAIMVTDYANIQGLKHNMEYAPNNPGFYSMDLDSRSTESAYTVVTSNETPTTISIEDVKEVRGSGEITYISGGPIQNHSNAAKVTSPQLPQVVTGNANTFYLSKGYDVIWMKV